MDVGVQPLHRRFPATRIPLPLRALPHKAGERVRKRLRAGKPPTGLDVDRYRADQVPDGLLATAQPPPIQAAPAQHRHCSASKEAGCSRGGCETSDPECDARGRAHEEAADAAQRCEHTRDAAPDPQSELVAAAQARANGQLGRGRIGVQAPEAEKQLLQVCQGHLVRERLVCRGRRVRVGRGLEYQHATVEGIGPVVIDKTQAKRALREDALHGGVDLFRRGADYSRNLQRERWIAQEAGRHHRSLLPRSFGKGLAASLHECMIDKLGRNPGFFRGGSNILEAEPFDLRRVGGIPPGGQLSRTRFEAAGGLCLQLGRTAPERARLLLGYAGVVVAHGIQGNCGETSTRNHEWSRRSNAPPVDSRPAAPDDVTSKQ